MKLRNIIAGTIALVLWTGAAFGQANQGSSALTVAKGGTGASTASGARTNLGLVIGSAVQAWDADLDALAALSGTNTIYYRSALNTWSPVTIGGLMSFSGGTLNVGDAELVALAGLTSAADKCAYFTGSGTAALTDCPSFGRSLMNTASSSAARTALGLVIGTDVQAQDAELAALAGLTSANNKCFYWTGSGTAATFDCSSFGRTLINSADASAGRTNLGVVIGTNVQAWDADLDALAALASNGIVARTGAGTAAVRTFTAPAAGFTITNGDAVSGNPTFVLANDLGALEALASTGFAVRTATDTWAQRTITGTANGVCVTNGDGVSGNPTLDVCSGFLLTAHSWAGVQTLAAPIFTGITDNQGTLKLSSFVTSTQITTSQNDYTATDSTNTCTTKTTLRISSNGAVNITGLSCGQAEGDIRIVHNVGSQTITLKNSDAGSTAANRLLLASDVSLPADYSITLRYDGVASRWRPLTTPGAGGGGGGSMTVAAGAGISVSGTCNGSTGTCTVAGSVPLPQGRLTLTTATPVMPASRTGVSTLFYDCYLGGSQVPYYTGSVDAIDTISGCEVSTTMVSAASAGQVVNGQVYDAWWVHSGANRICLAMSASTGGGGGWASDTGSPSNTARGTGYSQLDTTTRPYITNKNALTNCFNGSTNYGSVSANQATYLGTIYATANGQTSHTFGASGTAPLFGVWNANNRVDVVTEWWEGTASWSYASTTVRALNASAIARVSLVRGLDEDGVSIFAQNFTDTNTGTAANFGFGINSTSVNTVSMQATGPSVAGVGSVQYGGNPGLGFNFIQQTEKSGAAVSYTAYGNSALSSLVFKGRM